MLGRIKVKAFNLLKFNDIYTLKLLKFFYKLSNNFCLYILIHIKL